MAYFTLLPPGTDTSRRTCKSEEEACSMTGGKGKWFRGKD